MRAFFLLAKALRVYSRYPFLLSSSRSPGGTLFDARKLANALHAQTLPIFYKSEKWQAMRSFWLSDRGKYLVQDQSSDSCLAGTVLVAGMTIGTPMFLTFMSPEVVHSSLSPLAFPLSVSP